MELTLPLTHNTGNWPAGSSRAGADVPGIRAVTVTGGIATQCPRDGGGAYHRRTARKKGDKLMTPGRTGDANSARREER